MNRRRKPVLLALLLGAGAMLAIGVVFAQATKAPRSGIFPDRLGDMTLAMYVDGPAAMDEVRALHGNAPGVRIDNAYLARYESAGVDRARFWVSDSASAEVAAALLESMRGKVASTGVFGQPSALTVAGATVYFVTGPPEIGLYNYLYARGRHVFWVQIDAADEAGRCGSWPRPCSGSLGDRNGAGDGRPRSVARGRPRRHRWLWHRRPNRADRKGDRDERAPSGRPG